MDLYQVLVTGHTGFIGRALTGVLELQNITWVGASRGNGFEIDSLKTLDILPKAETVVHLAARTHVPASWQEPEQFFSTNYLTTLAVLEFARINNAKIIYVSSYVYGNPQKLPIDENHPVTCPNPYAASKYAGEILCRFYADMFDVSTTILRPFNIYGAGQCTDRLIPHIIQQASEGLCVHVRDVTPKRDYLFIDDFVDAILRIVKNQKNSFHLYNIGYGESHSVQQVIEAILSVMNISLPIHTSQEKRLNEIDDCIANSEKFAEDYTWVPSYNLRRGLNKMIGQINGQQQI